MNKIKIIFVCLGNYCRSPMAEAILKALVDQDNLNDYFDISSAATENWDVGLPPDHRSRKLLKEHYIPLDPNKRAELMDEDDLTNADYLIAMTSKIADALGNGKNVVLLMDFLENPSTINIPDPYPTNTFPQAFELINAGVRAFYDYLKNKYSLC